MKKIYLLAIMLVCQLSVSFGQSCDPLTPSDTLDLTGKPDSLWISQSVVRYGLCCAASGADKCIEFSVTLDPGAAGIVMNIYSGALPPGALFYMNNCADSTMMTDTMLLSGPGPHRIVFCKPGNNTNSYSVQSLPKPIAAFTQSSDSICQNDCVTFTDNSLNAPATWNWSFTGGSPSTSNVQNPVVCYAAPGTYSAMLIVSNSLGVDTTFSTINVNNLGAIISSQADATCGSCNGTSTSTATGGIAPYSYAWDNSQTGSTATGLCAGVYTVTITDYFGCQATTTSPINNTGGPSLTTSTTAVTCFGGSDGSATVTVSSGSPPYTYEWTPGLNTTAVITNISAGAYTVAVTDLLGCVTYATAIVTEPTGIVSTISNTSPNCFGGTDGTAIESASGGIVPYTYFWNTSPVQTASTATGLSSGIYVVMITDANGCTRTDSTIVIGPSPLVVSAGSDLTVCVGTSVNLLASGAANYIWNTSEITAGISVSPLVNTSYYVDATDTSGCAGSDTVIVFVNLNPTVSVNDTAICYATLATLTASGATNYNWNTSETTASILVSPSGTSIYYVTGTDTNGCSAIDSSLVTVISSTDITGHLSYSGGNFTSGNVVLITQGASSSQFDTVGVVFPDALGNYLFSGITAGNYYVRSEIDSSSIITTYFGDVYLWDSAVVINHGCQNTDTANIVMIELPALSGPGTITGTVYEGVGFGLKIIPGTPVPFANVIPGVPVKVGKNPSGTIVASGSTDANGSYYFDNLPIDDYRIYIDIPGYPMDSSYVVSITGSSDSIVNLDYVVDSNSIYIDITAAVTAFQKPTASSFAIFPNPAKENATFAFEVNENSNVNLELFNLQGEKIAVLLNRNFEKGNYNEKINLGQFAVSEGVYVIKASINNNQRIVRLVVLR
jgi:hypothetical protein